MILFYDTCSLLNLQKLAFQSHTKFYISNLTLNELEGIKTAGFKDEETKYAARQLLHLLSENEDKYEIIIYKNEFDNIIALFDLPSTTDSKIIATAYYFYKNDELKFPKDEKMFVTDDLACAAIAKSIGIPTKSTELKSEEDYTGYKRIEMSEDEIADFYSDILINNKNAYNLYYNQYLIVSNKNHDILDKYKWTPDGYIQVNFQKIESRMYGKILPFKGDVYQQLAIDSLTHNQLTVLRGKAGSGKSYLGLGYLLYLLERGVIDRIIIFCNPCATRGACRLGFYPGDKEAKLLDAQIGNFLVTKIGDRGAVEKMIDDGSLMLVPIADCRGMDTAGVPTGVYLTEAQNSTIDLMKLVLQRIGEDSYCVIEGDDKTQVDMHDYAGANNGLSRLSEVFRGETYYGEVTLQNCYRSKIAARAEEM